MNNDLTALTPEATLLWPSIFQPESFEGGEEKYRATLLFNLDADMEEVENAIRAAMVKRFPGKEKRFYESLRIPLRDGNEKAIDKDGNPDPESYYHDKLFMNVKSTRKPEIVDIFNQPITDEKLLYGGCKVVALLYFAGFEHKGNRGVSAYLNAIMKTADGPPLGGGKVDTAVAFSRYIKTPTPEALRQHADRGTGSATRRPFRTPDGEDLKDHYSDPAEDIQY